MSDTDEAYEAVERLDYLDRQESDRPGFDRRAFLRRTALTGVAAGSVSTIQSSGSSAGRCLACVVTTRPRLGENHSHWPGGGPVLSAVPISGPDSPCSSRSVLRSRLACCRDLRAVSFCLRSNP